MRKFGAILSVVLCCILFMGSVGQDAPVLPSRNFYINDHSSVINKRLRDAMLETATELFEKTGTQIVVLTVQNLGDMSVEDYAGSIFDGWKIGGETGNGALILTSTGDGQTLIRVGGGLRNIVTEETSGRVYKDIMEPRIKTGDYATGLYEGFIDITNTVFDHYGEQSSVADPGEKNIFSLGRMNYAIIIVAALLIALRGFRVSARYRKRYNAPLVYKRKTYTRESRSDDDDYPSGFGGAVTVKERDYEELSEEVNSWIDAGNEDKDESGKPRK